MREPVCIVLNERESAKARAAETLIARLKAHNITASRLEADHNLENLVLERRPKVLVLDYLLGDYSTGLDVLTQVTKLAPENQPKTFFLTDEPSLQVAVNALRLGALNFYELENPEALPLLVKEIRTELEKMPSRRLAAAPRCLALDDLILNGRASQRLSAELRTTLLKRSPVVILCGAAGSGLTTLAEAMQLEQAPKYKDTLDLARSIEPLTPRVQNLLIRVQDDTEMGLALILDHLEDDDGEILTAVSDVATRLWPRGRTEHLVSIIGTTTDPGTAKAWAKLMDAQIIFVPPLSERQDDISALVQRFVQEAEDLSGKKIKPFSAETISLLANSTWTGDLKELRGVVLDMALRSALTEKSPKDLITELLAVRDELQKPDPAMEISPLTVALTFALSGRNYRIAAAKLGVTPRKIWELLNDG